MTSEKVEIGRVFEQLRLLDHISHLLYPTQFHTLYGLVAGEPASRLVPGARVELEFSANVMD